MYRRLTNFLGSVAICYFALRLIYNSWRMVRLYILPFYGFSVDIQKFGRWAVVTGASDGIGKAYAIELAKRGFDLVLISRTQEKLENVSNQIITDFAVETKIIKFEFGKDTNYKEIEAVINSLDIGVLVNNVATDVGKLQAFYKSDLKLPRKIIEVNIAPDVLLTRIVMRGMVKRQRGIVVHISSAFAFTVVPYFNIYPASKAFVSHFAKTLQLECNPFPNIHHQLVTPHYVQTSYEERSETILCPSAENFVKSAIRTIGLSEEVAGYWSHELERIVFGRIPQFCKDAYVKRKLSVFGHEKPGEEE